MKNHNEFAAAAAVTLLLALAVVTTASAQSYKMTTPIAPGLPGLSPAHGTGLEPVLHVIGRST